MSIQALSSGGCYVPSTPRAEKCNQRPQEPRPDACGGRDDDEPRSHRRGGGTSALFDALADELRAIAQPAAAPKPAGEAAAASDAPAAADDTAADATPATPTKEAPASKPVDLREALKGFAEALFDGLRDVASEGRESGGCGHHGRGHGWGRGGMSRLADRIEALAQKLAAAATPSAPTAPSAPKTEPAPAASGETPASTATADPAAVTAPTTTADAVQTDKAQAVVKAAPSGLEASFATLWQALNPDRLQEQGGLADLLAFLHRLADRLDGEHAGGKGSTGLLVDTVA